MPYEQCLNLQVKLYTLCLKLHLLDYKLATTVFSDILYLADNIVIPVDFSNWGITKTLLSICNLENEERASKRRSTLFLSMRDFSLKRATW